MTRHRNNHLKKRCDCPRRQWAKCPHPWHFGFRFKGVEHRVSLDKYARGRGLKAPTNKSEAEAMRDELCSQVRAGTFREQASPSAAAAVLTVGAALDTYLKVFVRTPERRARATREMEYLVSAIRAAFGDRPLDAVTTGEVEDWRTARTSRVGSNRVLSRMRHFYRWAIAREMVDRTPFARHGVNVIKLAKEGGRKRRLMPGEEEALLTNAGPHLHALIVAALETGCRRGELLSLQWSDVNLHESVIVLDAAKTKTSRSRVVPITDRLKAVLEMRRNGPDGNKLPADAYVFGDDCGGQEKSIRRAWDEAVLKANGIAPRYVKNRGSMLVPECRAELDRINLHFHDLRREFGSRLLEAGVPLQTVRDWLGHADVSTTNNYLAASDRSLQDARRKFEEASKLRTLHAQTASPEPDHRSDSPAGVSPKPIH